MRVPDAAGELCPHSLIVDDEFPDRIRELSALPSAPEPARCSCQRA
jgi:hypothetical protein